MDARTEGRDAVVGKEEGTQAAEKGEVGKAGDGVVSEVYCILLVLYSQSVVECRRKNQ